MKYCPKCGSPMNDDMQFCPKCGTDTVLNANVSPEAFASPAKIEYDTRFAAVTVRYRCPNGHVFDGNANMVGCPHCGAPLPKGGYIQIYRKGSPNGLAVGMGLYVDDQPIGHLANKQSVRISVPFGQHKLHVTFMTLRRCNDPVFNITPDAPYAFCKVRNNMFAFSLKVRNASSNDMPTK